MPITKLRPTFTFDQDRLAQLRALAPEAFADGKINWEVLKEALGENLEDESPNAEHFGLFWPGKREARRFASKPSSGTLIPAPGEGVDEETTHNIFIEGDNLEVLKLLQKSYAGQVKMIYIDPPYNTGNDFVYEDNFAEPLGEYLVKSRQMGETGVVLTTNPKSSGRYHSNWLNMMYPRLRLASNLLDEEGFLIVSISDHESSSLRLILNEILGEESFVAQLVWKSRQFPDARSVTHVSTDHEYILVYSRQSANSFRGVPRDESKFSNPDNDARGPWMSRSILGLATVEQRPNLHYKITDPKTGISYSPPANTGWRYGQQRMKELIDHELILFPKNPDGRPREKKFRADILSEFSSFPSIVDDIYTSDGTAEIRKIFEFDAFDFPKPAKLIQLLIEQTTKSGDLILDFFAGSCTTANATFEQNQVDSYDRSFILVQLPEPIDSKNESFRRGFENIAEIGKERIRRVSKKLKAEGAKGDLGFRVFKLAPSNFKQWRDYDGQDVDALEEQFAQFETPLVEGWTRENLLTEILLQQGFPLDSNVTPQKEFTKNEIVAVSAPASAHKLFVCLDEKIHDATIKELKLAKRDIFICLDAALSSEAKVRLGDATNLVVI